MGAVRLVFTRHRLAHPLTPRTLPLPLLDAHDTQGHETTGATRRHRWLETRALGEGEQGDGIRGHEDIPSCCSWLRPHVPETPH